MDQNILKGKWTEFKGELQKAWGNITNDELEKTKGDFTAIRGLVQQKYGQKKEENEQRLNSLFERFADRKDAALEDVKEDLRH